MLARVMSGGIVGIDAFTVEIEVNCGGGDKPSTVVVGLPDAAVKESKDRVETALANSGFVNPWGRVTINLAPADVKKEGPSYDLPIAVGMIAAQGDLSHERLTDYCLVGELALSGEVRRVRGVLPIALHARQTGFKGMLVPVENVEEAAVVDGLDVFPVKNLREAADFLAGEHPMEPFRLDLGRLFKQSSHYEVDFADVKGQESAKRAIEIAVSGGHNILLIGPPGTGKTMLAKRVASILPEMTLDEALHTTKIHSISGKLAPHRALVAQRPFRSPHHTISDAGLLGGGSHPMPGEVSLAHHGVLFLDELPEFHRNVLEVMRQPLEDGEVTISRAASSLTFPCRFMLVAAMNPCPCGFFTDPQRECRCTPQQIQRYRNKISGPLLDRIDLHVEVPPVKYSDLAETPPGEPSEGLRGRVLQARRVQQERFRTAPRLHCNADMGAKQVQQHCRLETEAADLLKMAMADLHLSARAYDRILKVARTIADLAGADGLMQSHHIAEAIQYRSLDREIWS